MPGAGCQVPGTRRWCGGWGAGDGEVLSFELFWNLDFVLDFGAWSLEL